MKKTGIMVIKTAEWKQISAKLAKCGVKVEKIRDLDGMTFVDFTEKVVKVRRLDSLVKNVLVFYRTKDGKLV